MLKKAALFSIFTALSSTTPAFASIHSAHTYQRVESQKANYADDYYEWFAYSSFFNKEHYQLLFPFAPNRIFKEESYQLISAYNENINLDYSLISYVIQEAASSDEILEKILFKLTAVEENYLIQSQVNEKDGFLILDFYLFDSREKLFKKMRALVTNRNLYFLITSFCDHAYEDHSRFIDSFSLIK